eukprot:4767056-Prymnesium_polylepis.1
MLAPGTSSVAPNLLWNPRPAPVNVALKLSPSEYQLLSLQPHLARRKPPRNAVGWHAHGVVVDTRCHEDWPAGGRITVYPQRSEAWRSPSEGPKLDSRVPELQLHLLFGAKSKAARRAVECNPGLSHSSECTHAHRPGDIQPVVHYSATRHSPVAYGAGDTACSPDAPGMLSNAPGKIVER